MEKDYAQRTREILLTELRPAELRPAQKIWKLGKAVVT